MENILCAWDEWEMRELIRDCLSESNLQEKRNIEFERERENKRETQNASLSLTWELIYIAKLNCDWLGISSLC